MPKAAMDKNNLTFWTKHKVRLAGEVSAVKAETVAEFMNYLTNQNFGLHPRAADRSHVGAASPSRNSIHSVDMVCFFQKSNLFGRRRLIRYEFIRSDRAELEF